MDGGSLGTRLLLSDLLCCGFHVSSSVWQCNASVLLRLPQTYLIPRLFSGSRGSSEPRSVLVLLDLTTQTRAHKGFFSPFFHFLVAHCLQPSDVVGICIGFFLCLVLWSLICWDSVALEACIIVFLMSNGGILQVMTSQTWNIRATFQPAV